MMMENLVGLNYDYVLPDYNLSQGANFKKLGDSFYCSSVNYDKFKKENPSFTGRSRNIENIEKKLRKNYLKVPSASKMERKNREIREGLDVDSYKHLIIAANLALKGNSVAVVSNNSLMEEAYVRLIDKNSYLNNENLTFFSNNLMEKENIENKYSASALEGRQDKKIVDKMQSKYNDLSEKVRVIMMRQGGKIPSLNTDDGVSRSKYIGQMRNIESEAKERFGQSWVFD